MMKDTFFGPALMCFLLIALASSVVSGNKKIRVQTILSGAAASRIWDGMEEFRQERDADLYWREDLAWRCRRDRQQQTECERKGS